MNKNIFINRRFCGPPDSGNGGYVCGLVASWLEGTVEVRLHKPPPLERPLDIELTQDNRVLLKDGDALIAQGKPSRIILDIPSPPSFDQAIEASNNYVSEEDHFFPTCFVCGPARKHKDGLRIFPGLLPGKRMVASPWIPDETLADETLQVKTEFIWASLDCPGAFAVLESSIRPVVLGSLTAEIMKRPMLGLKCITVGWKIGAQGRKLSAGTALFSEGGELLAKAQAIWIDI